MNHINPNKRNKVVISRLTEIDKTLKSRKESGVKSPYQIRKIKKEFNL